MRVCPLCGGDGRILAQVAARAFVEVNDTYRSDWSAILGVDPEGSYPLARCGGCSFVFAGILPAPDFLDRVYEDVIDGSRTYTETRAGRRGLVAFAAALLDLLPEKVPLNVLDYGCGYGRLLAMLGSRDLRAVGWDPSPSRAEAATRAGVRIVGSEAELDALGPFDMVVCREVLEHVGDPRRTLRTLRHILAPGGLLALTVPDFGDRRLEAALRALAQDRPIPRTLNLWEHLCYFSPDSLRRLLAEEGFQVVADLGARADVGRLAAGYLEEGLGRRIRGAGRVARRVLAGGRKSTQVVVST